MPTLRDLLLGVLLPSIIGLIAGFFATRGDSRPWWRAGLATLGVGLAYALSRWALWGLNDFPPKSVFEWLPCIAVALGLIMGLLVKSPIWLRVLMTVVVAMAALVPTALRDSDLTTPLKIVTVIGLGGVLAVVALMTEATALRAPVSTLAGLITAGTIASITLLIPLSSASQAQALGILCAGLGGVMAAVLFTCHAPVHLATLGVVLLGATLFAQQRFGNGSIAVLVLLAVSPFGVVLGALPPLRGHPWYAAGARITGVVLLAGIALALAVFAAQAASTSSPY